MQYTSTEVLTILAAVVAVITAVGAVIVNIIVATKTTSKVTETLAETKMVAKVASESLAGTTVLQEQVKEVHTLTNANLTRATNALEQSVAENTILKELINDLKSERAAAALAVAFQTPTAAPAQAPGEATTVKADPEAPLPVTIVASTPVPVEEQGGKDKPPA